MRRNDRKTLSFCLCLVLLLLAACGAEPTAEPTQIVQEPTDSPVSPTGTDIQPTATITPPTATPDPTSTPTPAPTPEPTPEQAETYYERGLAHLDQGDLESAIDAFDRAIELDPEYAEAYLARGQVYHRQGALEEAIADFDLAIELDDGWAEAYRYRGEAYRVLGELDQAIADCDQAIELDPDSAEGYRCRGDVHLDMGELDLAFEDFEQAIELDPEDARSYAGRAFLHAYSGEFDAAFADFDRAIELDPDDPRAFSIRGFLFYLVGDHDQAYPDVQRAIELGTLDGEPYAIRGVTLAESEDYEAAIPHLVRGLELGLDPYLINSEAVASMLVDAAHTLACQGEENLETAEAAYQQATALVPSCEVTARQWNNLCWCGSLWGHAAEFVYACELAVELAPDDGAIRDARGLARALSGDSEGALGDYRFFLDWGQDRRPQEMLEPRQVWVEELEVGRDPFDETTLESLRTGSRPWESLKATGERTVTETLLLETDPWSTILVHVSPDGRRLVHVVSSDDGQYAVIEDETEGPYSEISEYLAFSPDSQHLAYVASDADSQFVVLDGEEHSHYDRIQSARPTFSPDSTRLAYIAQSGSEALVVVDGEEGKPYATIGDSGLLFSPDSQHVAYIAGDAGSWFMVVDGVEGQPYDEVFMWEETRFSPDSQHLAYLARDDDLWFAVLDGEEGSPYDYVRHLVFSPDSQHLAYQAERGEKAYIVLDGKELAEYDRALDPSFSPDSQHLAYEARAGDEWFVVVDGTEEELRYGFTLWEVFSPDSQRLAYTAEVGDREVLVVDGEELGPYDSLGIPIFSPDSRRLVYSVFDEGEERVFVDGLVLGYHPSGGIYHLAFSADSQHIIYEYSPLYGEDYDTIVVDGKEGGHYDWIYKPGPVFDSDTSFHYVAERGNQVYLVEESLGGAEEEPSSVEPPPIPMATFDSDWFSVDIPESWQTEYEDYYGDGSEVGLYFWAGDPDTDVYDYEGSEWGFLAFYGPDSTSDFALFPDDYDEYEELEEHMEFTVDWGEWTVGRTLVSMERIDVDGALGVFAITREQFTEEWKEQYGSDENMGFAALIVRDGTGFWLTCMEVPVTASDAEQNRVKGICEHIVHSIRFAR